MAIFVLVHGAWRAGWCWAGVARQLRALGHEVYAPSLTGLGDRSHLAGPGIDLETHILDITHLLIWEDLRDVILCGHSYGGMVITGTSDRVENRIKTLVYLDAFIPENGQTMLDLTLPERRTAHTSRIDRESGGWAVNPPQTNLSNSDVAAMAMIDHLCTPHPLACFEQPIRLSRKFPSVARRIFVEARRFSPSPFALLANRLRLTPDWEVHSIDAGHDLMIEQPRAVASLLTMISS